MVEKFRDKAKQWGEGAKLIEQASTLLKDVLDKDADRVTVDWDRTEDEHGSPFYTLTLRDNSDQAQGRLAPEDFQNPTNLRFRLSRIWRDLLRVKTDRLLQAMREGRNAED